MRRTVRDTLWGDPLTCETGVDGVFAGGETVSGPSTVIQSLALGRRAAESAHRYLSGIDLREGREEVLPSRLLWTLEIDEAERRRRERTPVMLQPCNEPMDEAQVREEAERCLDCECGLCVKDCEFLKKHCESPKDLARRVLDDNLGEALTEIYSCNLCSLCATVCPEDLDTGTLLLEARNEAVLRNQGPMPVHKGIVGYFNAGVSKTFSLLRPEPGRQKCKRLFFTGCGLPAIAPRNTIRAYDELRKHFPGTGVMMYCCGAPVEMLGMKDPFRNATDEILRMAESVGAEELVPACPDCVHTLQESVPDLKITPIWELLAEKWSPPRLREGEEIAIHDSCKARHMTGIHDAVRKLLTAGGGEVEDYEYNGELARCCGFGGMIYPVDTELSQQITDRRAAESDLPMITYCAGCRMALASRGKEAIHILDFLLASDWRKASRKKPPGSIPRYVNRLRTKWAFKRLRPLGPK
jgi:Fe-S oxidoreductase